MVWEGIPTSTTSVPILNIKDSIGNITFNMHLRVAVDDKYFYILDGGAKKIYVWLGLPTGKTDSPDFTLTADANRIRSDGKYLVATSLYNSPHILVWNVSTLQSGAEPTGKVAYAMNLPQDAITSGEALYVADTSFHRVLYWSSITSAMSGVPQMHLSALDRVHLTCDQARVRLNYDGHPRSGWKMATCGLGRESLDIEFFATTWVRRGRGTSKCGSRSESKVGSLKKEIHHHLR